MKTLARTLMLAGILAVPAAALAAQDRTGDEPPVVQEVEKRGAAVSEEAEHEEEGPPRPINLFDFANRKQPPYLAALINFGLLALLYYSLGKKPLAEGLKNRRISIAKEIEEAKRMKQEAEERATHYQAKLANLEEELAATKRALEEAGKGERERIVKEAEEKAARMQRDATFLLEQEVKQMRLDLVRETVDQAVAA